MMNDDGKLDGSKEPTGDGSIHKVDVPSSAPSSASDSDILYCPEFLEVQEDIQINNEQGYVDRGFACFLENGQPIKASWSELESASDVEREQFGGVVYRSEELVSHFSGALDLISRNIFMMGRPEWDEGKFGDSHRIYIPQVRGALASKDLAKVAVLVEVVAKESGKLCLPPWQAIYPGPATEFGDYRGGTKSDIHKKRVKVATGVTLNVNSEIAPEDFDGDVALIVTPRDDAELDVLFAPRRGDHDFEAEPVFGSRAWERALGHLTDDVRLLENSMGPQRGNYGFGLFDIAKSKTSFLLGYLMVVAREQSHKQGWGESIILPTDLSLYRTRDGIAGDTLEIRQVTGTSSWGVETRLAITLSIDPIRRLPNVLVKKI
jgi:hypothetical protein